jgi:hypothetical protein
MADRASRQRLRSASASRRGGSTVTTAPEPASSDATADGDRAIGAAARAIVAYIPAEIVTVYVAATALITVPGAKPAGGQWWLMWITLVLTPLTVWATVALKTRNTTGVLPLAPATWPWLQIVLASVAFILWAFSLPNTPFENLNWYRPVIGGVALLIGTLVVGLIASLVEPSEATRRQPRRKS